MSNHTCDCLCSSYSSELFGAACATQDPRILDRPTEHDEKWIITQILCKKHQNKKCASFENSRFMEG